MIFGFELLKLELSFDGVTPLFPLLGFTEGSTLIGRVLMFGLKLLLPLSMLGFFEELSIVFIELFEGLVFTIGFLPTF